MTQAEVQLPDYIFNVKAFTSELSKSQSTTTTLIKDKIAAVNEYLNNEFVLKKNARELIKIRAKFVDLLLQTLWEKYNSGSSKHSLIACGGYGRSELFPHSDLDILILLGDSKNKRLQGIEKFLTELWDLGLNLGHSVRTVEDCVTSAASDITILTNLMEARLLFGDRSDLRKVKELTSTDYMWPSSDFFKAKLEEQRNRHEKFADTEYNLEPNVKSSPGGLRDIQFIGWIAERFLKVESIEQVFQRKLISAEDIKTLSSGQDFLWQVRFGLHMLSGREDNRLLFEYQRELAASWGYTDDNRLGVEKFMQTYYRCALTIGQVNEILVQHFEQVILRANSKNSTRKIDVNFINRNGYLDIKKENLIEKHPFLLLSIFKVLGCHAEILGPSAKSIQLVRKNIHLIDNSFREDSKNKKIFLEILKSPHRMTLQLRRMARYGVLSAYLPPFGRIVGQMQHDLFHVYTVDAHTLEVVQNMRRFLKKKYESRFPVSSVIARQLPKIELLYIAGLFHDIGKGRGGDHSSLGAAEAKRFCTEHDLNPDEIELVTWLVKNHLLMSSVAQRKDISDPFVINEFAYLVGNENRLNYLFTLTVADINGTNPNLWNAWRGSLIRQLFTETKRAMKRGLEKTLDKNDFALSTKEKAEKILLSLGFSHNELFLIWDKLSGDYFVREQAEDIAWHTAAMVNHQNKNTPLVLVRNTTGSSVANATQIFTFNKPTNYLFSVICGELELLELSVQDARIYSDKEGMALYNFSVLNMDSSTLEGEQTRLQTIEQHLTSALSKRRKRPKLVKRRTPRQKKSFRFSTKTNLYKDSNQNISILEVASRDRPGLLAKIATIFEEHNIILKAAKIQTLGERVEDVFFLTTVEGNPLDDKTLCESIQNSIRTELDKSLNV